jgi:hypothetical protein
LANALQSTVLAEADMATRLVPRSVRSSQAPLVPQLLGIATLQVFHFLPWSFSQPVAETLSSSPRATQRPLLDKAK